MAAVIQANAIDWSALAGRALHVETSMSHLWALSEKNEIMRCRLPCSEESWWKPVSNTNYVSISANPFEIWAVDSRQNVFRCRFPCRRAEDFHLIAHGFKQVSLGLSEAWAVSSTNRVAKAVFEFAKENSPIDRSKLNWNYVGEGIQQVSVGEDGEVWGVKAGTGATQIVRFFATDNRWIDVPGTAKAVDVGADYVFAINAQGHAMRCLRPCKNGGWEMTETTQPTQIKTIAARFNNPGTLFAVGANPKENLIMVGNSAWSERFFALDPSMPFYRFRNKRNKGTTLGAFSPYFIPDWHVQYMQQTPSAPHAPF